MTKMVLKNKVTCNLQRRGRTSWPGTTLRDVLLVQKCQTNPSSPGHTLQSPSNDTFQHPTHTTIRPHDGSENAAARARRGDAGARALRCTQAQRAPLTAAWSTLLMGCNTRERRGTAERSLFSFAVEKRAEKGFQVGGKDDSCGVSSCVAVRDDDFNDAKCV